MLKVSRNGRFLVHDDGKETPFFYLGDTAWELFHRLSFDEAARYLENRAAKGFTVIQAVALAEEDGLGEPNRNGDLPLKDNDPAQPNEAYFAHVDRVVDKAASLGLYTGFLPTWGDKVNQRWGKGPEIFTPENAFAYGQFLGERYKSRPIIWIVGGDRDVANDTQREIWKSMARGLSMGDSGAHLKTYHPQGQGFSSKDFHSDNWLDFNMIQSGHRLRDIPNGDWIAEDYARTPIKPCLDGEPCYENHPVRGLEREGKHDEWFDEYDVRKAAYRAVFAGAMGHTYGCHDIWQFNDPTCHAPVTRARTYWRDALDLPGALQMRHLRSLMESRPFLSRVPDQTLLASGAGEGARHCRATRDENSTYAFVYTPLGEPVSLQLDTLASGGKLSASWFDPRTGITDKTTETFAAMGTRSFTPPTSGPKHDWVLILDAVQ